MTPNDPDFMENMKSVLGLDEKAVKALIDELNADQLEELTDALANEDQDAARAVVKQFINTDEDVNVLFRGENLDNLKTDKKKRMRNTNGDMQFAYGDDVMIKITGDDGKRHSVSATVQSPHGPEGTDTLIVRVKGKPMVVSKNDVDRLDEGVIGMINMPELTRMQQLAGIPAPEAQMTLPSVEAEVPEVVEFEEPSFMQEPAADDPLAKTMAALDTLEATIPNLILADVKAVRARLSAVQTAMYESVRDGAAPLGRAKKR